MKSFVLALFLGAASAYAPQSASLFATGMNGDEDLGEDITMKGDKFHYTQVAVPRNLAPKPRLNQVYNRDINNGEVRPDVWFEVSKMVDPVSQRRAAGPPTTKSMKD